MLCMLGPHELHAGSLKISVFRAIHKLELLPCSLAAAAMNIQRTKRILGYSEKSKYNH